MAALDIEALHTSLHGTAVQTAESLRVLMLRLTELHGEVEALYAKQVAYAETLKPGALFNGAMANDGEIIVAGSTRPSSAKSSKTQGKPFDMSNYHSRFVALEIMYIGWKYNGSTFQSTNSNTIEGRLVEVLKHSHLISPAASLESIRFSRCGRTDSGVSARGQVVSLMLRSKARLADEKPDAEHELDYPRILNRNLPNDIRVTGWRDVPPSFDARFSTEFREYQYFIPCNRALDVEAMQRAASALVGQHDYRNFCKVDAEHVHHFVRHIIDFQITPLPNCHFGNIDILQVHIRGSAFLWHQVRCMVAVLLMIGKRQEDPCIVSEMLDVQHWGCKPQYRMADEEPLLLYSCNFKDLEFWLSSSSAERNYTLLEETLHRHLARSALLYTIAQKLRSLCIGAAEDVVVQNEKHIPLKRRGREPSLEHKFSKYGRTLK